MNLIEALLILTLQPVFSPTYPWPLPNFNPSPQEVAQPIHGTPEGPVVPWFPESLEFAVKWGFLTAGQATLSVTQIDLLESPSPFGDPSQLRTAYRLVSTARSNSFLDTFYKVRDINQSWIDTRSLTSLAFSKKIREGRFRRDEWIRFFPEAQRFLSERQDRKGNRTYQQGPTAKGVHDILSALYFVRTQPLRVGQEIVLDVNTRKNWPLLIRVKNRETIVVPAGRFDCFVVEPQLRAEGIFIQKGRRLEVWLTADEKKIPVQMEVEVFFGHISAKLERIRRL